MKFERMEWRLIGNETTEIKSNGKWLSCDDEMKFGCKSILIESSKWCPLCGTFYTTSTNNFTDDTFVASRKYVDRLKECMGSQTECVYCKGQLEDLLEGADFIVNDVEAVKNSPKYKVVLDKIDQLIASECAKPSSAKRIADSTTIDLGRYGKSGKARVVRNVQKGT